MKASNRSVGIALLGLLATGIGCSKGDAQRSRLPPEQAQRLLLDRNWLDQLPESPRDRLHVFRFVPSMGGGVYQDRTLFAGQFELFNFEHDGEHVTFHLHHTGDDVTVRYAIERLPHDPEAPFDLHLHLDGSPRGPSDYYSIRGMNEKAESLDDSLRALWQKPGR